MKLKEFFKGKSFIFCFIAYILITVVIIGSSLTDAVSSGKQSDFISQTFSNVVKFITGGSVDLNANGNTEKYPEGIQLNNIPNRELMVGESFFLSYEFIDGKEYDSLTPTYYSTNTDVLAVNSKTGEVNVLSTGSASLGVKEERAVIKCEVEVTVGNGEFIPRLEIIKGSSEIDGNYYFNPFNNIGSLYYIYIDTQIDPNSLSVYVEDEEAFELLPSTSTLVFLTKKVGSFDILVSGKYKNINTITSGLEQSITKSFNVNVVSSNLDKPTNDFAFTNETINVYKNEKCEIEFFNDRSDTNSNLLESQTSLYQSYDRDLLKVESENNKLYVTPKSIGTFEYKIYYSDGLSIKTAILNVNSIFKTPTQIEFISTNKNVVYGYTTYLSIIGDGQNLDEEDFIWTSTNKKVATVKNGKVIGQGFGKVTITATAKYNENVKLEISYQTVPSLEYLIRKILGHFMLFALLAFFAKIVYFRLANVTIRKHVYLFSVIFTILAGTLTAFTGEILQLDIFVFERGFSFVDILINLLGYVFGFLVTIGITSLVKRRKNEQV
ncbi:MAG: VanZ family protein [Clostridia bacterium]|nr:VanZ family protein [Clostridia bacterium]